MPSTTEKPLPDGIRGSVALSVATLVLALFLLTSVLAARLFEESDGRSAVEGLLENEAVAAFLTLDGEE